MTHGSGWRRYRHKRALTPGLVWKHAQTIYLEKQWSNFVARKKPASELNQWQSDPGLLTYSNFPKGLIQRTAVRGYGNGRHYITDTGRKLVPEFCKETIRIKEKRKRSSRFYK